MTLPRWIGVLVAMLGVTAVLGLLPSYDRSLSYGYLGAWVFSAALYFVALVLIRSWDAARRMSYFLVLAGVLVVIYFLTQHAYRNYEEMPAFILRIGQMTTVLPDLGLYKLHPNSVATFVEGIIPLALALMIATPKPLVKGLMVLAALLMLFGVVMSFSRGAFAGLAVGGLLAALLYLRRKPALVMLLLVVGVVGVLVAARFGLVDKVLGWGAGRLFLYQTSARVGGDFLFTGLGIGTTFAEIYSRFGLMIYVPYLQHPHDLFLWVWMGNGLLGLLALIGVVIAGWWWISRVLRFARPQLIYYAMAVGLAIIMVHSLLDLIMPVAFILLGMVVSLGQLALREADWQPQPSRRPLYVGAGALALVIALVAIFNAPLRAAWYTNLGAIDDAKDLFAPGLSDAEHSALFDSAEAYYHQALAIDPNWPGASRRLGAMALRSNHFDEAVPLLEQANAVDPGHPTATKGLGLAYTWVGRIDDALALFRTVNDPHAMASELYTWGYNLGGQGLLLQQARSWAAGIRLDDEVNLSLWNTIASLYAEAGDADQARAWYEQVLAVEPDNAAALQGLADLESGASDT